MIKYHPASAINNNIKISARIVKYWIWSNIMKSYEIIKDSVDPKRRPFFITWICFRNHPQNHRYSSYSLDINCPSSGCSIFLTISRSFRSQNDVPQLGFLVSSTKSMDFALVFFIVKQVSSSTARFRPPPLRQRFAEGLAQIFHGTFSMGFWGVLDEFILYIYIYIQ